MFKDFHRRLQRDIKKIVDARVLASDTARLPGDVKVSIYSRLWLGSYYFSSGVGVIRLRVIFNQILLPGTACGSECSQSSNPEIRCLVWWLCPGIHPWIFYGTWLLPPSSVKFVMIITFICKFKYLLFIFIPQACHTKAEYEESGASICRTNPVFKGMYWCQLYKQKIIFHHKAKLTVKVYASKIISAL